MKIETTPGGGAHDVATHGSEVPPLVAPRPLGADTDAILGEMGLTTAEIASLRRPASSDPRGGTAPDAARYLTGGGGVSLDGLSHGA